MQTLYPSIKTYAQHMLLGIMLFYRKREGLKDIPGFIISGRYDIISLYNVLGNFVRSGLSLNCGMYDIHY